MRQRLTDVADILTHVESMLLKLVQQEAPGSKLQNALQQEHMKFESTLQSFGGPRTHVQALENVENISRVVQGALNDFVKIKQVSLYHLNFRSNQI